MWWHHAPSGKGLSLGHPRLPPCKHHSGAPGWPRWCELSCWGKHRCLFTSFSIFKSMVDKVLIALASCLLTLAHLLLPYDWPAWHHVTKHHTATSGVQSRRTEHFPNAHRRACWCQPLWHPSLFCHGKKSATCTWICCLINWLFVGYWRFSLKCCESKLDKWKK